MYSGGKFKIDIVLTNEYPYKPPKMKFDTSSLQREALLRAEKLQKESNPSPGHRGGLAATGHALQFAPPTVMQVLDKIRWQNGWRGWHIVVDQDHAQGMHCNILAIC